MRRRMQGSQVSSGEGDDARDRGDRQRADQRSRGRQRVQHLDRSCPWCRTTFAPRHGGQTYCTRRCVVAACRARQRPADPWSLCCPFCGVAFMSANPKRRFCSRRCGIAAYNVCTARWSPSMSRTTDVVHASGGTRTVSECVFARGDGPLIIPSECGLGPASGALGSPPRLVPGPRANGKSSSPTTETDAPTAVLAVR